jgi:hypothetical protein
LKKLALIICLACLGFATNLSAQDWKFIKEKDGIKIYTRSDETNPVKSYRGETTLNTTMEKISHIIGRIESFDWWEEDISTIDVLEYKEEEFIKYYLIYDIPWPLDDRDLCVKSIITNDSVTGKRTVFATPMEGVIPEKPGLVRIKNYWQKWEMEPVGEDKVYVILEGSVDPAGAIPSWIVNMVITDTPLNIINKVRVQVAK